MNKNILRQLNFFFFLVFLVACSTIDVFNQRAYEQATSLKVEALFLIDNASDSYINYETEVNQLKLNAKKAYEYSKGRQKNEESTKQWEIVVNSERNSLFGFLKRWKDKGKLNSVFIVEAKKIISEGFDAIIELESGKRK